MSPVVSVLEEFMLFNAAMTKQTEPEARPSSTGDLAGGPFPVIPLTPCPEATSRHGDELDVVGGSSEVADLSREGRLTFTRIIHVPLPLRSYCRTPRDVYFGWHLTT